MKVEETTSVCTDDDDDPFYKYDEFGRPLDADTVARRAILKRWKRMSREEWFAEMVAGGFLNPDGSLTEHYADNGEPSKYRPAD